MMAAMLHVEGDGVETLLGDDFDGQRVRHARPGREQRFVGGQAGFERHRDFPR